MEDWRKDLKKLLEQKYLTTAEIDAVKKKKNIHIPKGLFKYQTFTENKLKSLEQESTWCACAETFNDPYDSVIPFDPSPHQKNELFKVCLDFLLRINNNGLFAQWELEKIKNSDTAREEYKTIVRSRGSDSDYRKFKSIIHSCDELEAEQITKWDEYINKLIRKGFKISCMSENLHSMPMWYHYADKHRGYVIEYDFQIGKTPKYDANINDDLWPVLYDDSIFDIMPYLIHVITTNEKVSPLFGYAAAINKSDEWSYEEEWRLIVKKQPTVSGENIKVPLPKAVYIGKDTIKSDKKRLIEICSRKGIPMYKMSLSKTKYRMEPIAL